MRNCKILGYGYYLPKQKVKFGDQTRYRSSTKETQLLMATKAAKNAIKNAELKPEEIDLIVAASAVGIQPIPCTASLIHEQIMNGCDTPAMDINTTCTSFITALDIVSYLIASGKYKNVLIVSSELASPGLPKDKKEICELFSDGAAAIILSCTDNTKQGVIASKQCTWSESAHATEIVGGLTGLNATKINENNYHKYFFKMEGLDILRACTRKLPKMFEEFKEDNNISINDIDLVIPHQASKALPLVMKKLGIPEKKYVNRVNDYGNQVSVSVPFILCQMLEENKIRTGDKIMLCGTAAGLTSNILLMRI
jgi:3-oxoacyl-[acyl-carrier-protein] synthase-3